MSVRHGLKWKLRIGSRTSARKGARLCELCFAVSPRIVGSKCFKTATITYTCK